MSRLLKYSGIAKSMQQHLNRAGLRERADPMRLAVLTHQAHPRGFWVADRKQVSALLGPVHGGPRLGHPDRPRAMERRREHAEVRCPLPLRLVVDLLRLPWGSWERRP